MSRTKKILLGVFVGLVLLGIAAYYVIKNALSTITFAIDNKSVQVDMPALLTGSLNGTLNLIITNPTVFPLPPFTLFLSASLPDGTAIGSLDTPGRFSVAPSGYTSIPVSFSADALNTGISGIINLAANGGHLNVLVSGYILIWGIFKVPINETIKAV